VKISGLRRMQQKKDRKSLNNIDQRAGIYSDFIHKRSPLLLFRQISDEG
jgi:hypothetical protein